MGDDLRVNVGVQREASSRKFQKFQSLKVSVGEGCGSGNVLQVWMQVVGVFKEDCQWMFVSLIFFCRQKGGFGTFQTRNRSFGQLICLRRVFVLWKQF